MALGLIGRKCGMTRVYLENGSAMPVTVVHVEPNRVVQVKTPERDGYLALQVTTGVTKRSRLSKALAGHYAKAAVEAGRGLWEFRLAGEDRSGLVPAPAPYTVGAELGVELFHEGQFVDVRGVSIGKGFAGVVKRHNFRTQDATHGNSLSHRAPGSIGQNQTPGRVFKGKRMAGHMGHRNVTVQNLVIHQIDKDRSLLLIRGAIPGPSGGDVAIVPAVKKKS